MTIVTYINLYTYILKCDQFKEMWNWIHEISGNTLILVISFKRFKFPGNFSRYSSK